MVYTAEQIKAMENEERAKWMAQWEREFDAEKEKDRQYRISEKARFKGWTEDEFNEWLEGEREKFTAVDEANRDEDVFNEWAEGEREHFLLGDFDWNDHDENQFQQEYVKLWERNHDDALERFADWFADKRASLETVD